MKQKMHNKAVNANLKSKSQSQKFQDTDKLRLWTETRTMLDKKYDQPFVNPANFSKKKAPKTGRTSAGTYTAVPSDFLSHSVRPGPGTDPDALARTLVTLSGAAENCKASFFLYPNMDFVFLVLSIIFFCFNLPLRIFNSASQRVVLQIVSESDLRL